MKIDIKTREELFNESKDLSEAKHIFRTHWNKKWVSVENLQFLKELWKYLHVGFGENRDFRNAGTDYQGREKIYYKLKALIRELEKEELLQKRLLRI